MKLEGEYIFNGPRDEVWNLIRDPDVLATALPGTQSLTRLSENEYEGAMNLHIGPVAGVFSGKVTISDEVPPESLTLTAEGKGAQGFGKGTGRVQLIEQEDGTTLLKYEGDVQVGGRLASVGQRNIDTVGRSMVRQGLVAIDKALEARLAAKAAGTPVEYTPPTEAQFAAAVAADVTREVVGDVAHSVDELVHSEEARRYMVFAGLAAILLALVLLLSRRQRCECRCKCECG